MQKISSLFARNYAGDRLVRDEVVPGAEWVPAGEGEATVKWDGTACLVYEVGETRLLAKRYDLPLTKEWANRRKRGYAGPWAEEMYQGAPRGFLFAQAAPDPTTGHWPGWVPVGAGPEDQWHRAAWANWHREHADAPPAKGTYELLGPKVQGNPYDLGEHILVRHGEPVLFGAPRTFAELRDFFTAALRIEGIVWHHPDGRLCKIKRKDFGLAWPPPKGDR